MVLASSSGTSWFGEFENDVQTPDGAVNVTSSTILTAAVNVEP